VYLTLNFLEELCYNFYDECFILDQGWTTSGTRAELGTQAPLYGT